MKTYLHALKKSALFTEFRYLYRSAVHYKKLSSYIRNRFRRGAQILNLPHPISTDKADSSYSIHVLTSHSDLLMLLWSLASWFSVVPESGKVYIHDDGSLNISDLRTIHNLLPTSTVLAFQHADELVLKKLENSYPLIRKFRKLAKIDSRYIYNLKLVDPYFTGNAQIKLILDSDLLWFRRPDELLAKITKRDLPFFMGVQDKGYMDFSFADGSKLSSNLMRVNSGIVGYGTEHFSLDKLETFFSAVDMQTNPHFVEQAGYAYVLSEKNKPNLLSTDRYHIKGSVSEKTAVKHYTSPRREQFWFEGVNNLSTKIFS